jgi:GT2 family glycosyltransferase
LSLTNEARFRLTEALYRDGRGPLAALVRKRMARSRAVDSLSGACMLLRRAAFEQVGGFDERFFLYAEDVDLCLRLRRAGGELVYVADAIVEHDRGASRATDPDASELHYRRSQIAFYRKHRGVLATMTLRAYLALRFGCRRLFGRGARQRRLAAELLRLTLRETGE